MKLKKMRNKVVNCKTEQEAIELLKIAKENEYKWQDLDDLEFCNLWCKYEKRICYRFNHEEKTVNCCSKSFYKKDGYKILSYKKDKHKIFKLEPKGDVVDA